MRISAGPWLIERMEPDAKNALQIFAFQPPLSDMHHQRQVSEKSKVADARTLDKPKAYFALCPMPQDEIIMYSTSIHKYLFIS